MSIFEKEEEVENDRKDSIATRDVVELPPHQFVLSNPPDVQEEKNQRKTVGATRSNSKRRTTEEKKNQKNELKKEHIFYRIVLTIFIFFMNASAGLLFTITGSTLGDLAVVMEIEEFTLAYVYLLRPVGMIVGGLMMSFLVTATEKRTRTDKWYSISFNKLFIAFYVCMVVPNWFTPIIKNAWIYLIGQFIMGIGWQSLIVLSPLMLGYTWTHYSKNVLSFIINVSNLFYAIASFLFPLLVTSNVYLFETLFTPRLSIAIINFGAISCCFIPYFIIFFKSPEKVFPKSEESSSAGNPAETISPTAAQSIEARNQSSTKKKSIQERIKESITIETILRLGITTSGFFLTLFYITVDSSIWYIVFSYGMKIGYSKVIASYLSTTYFLAYLAGRITCSIFGGFWKSNVMLCIVWLTMLSVFSVHIFIPTNKIMIWITSGCGGFLFSWVLGLIVTSPNSFQLKLSGRETSFILMGLSIGNCFAWLTNFLMEYLSAEFFIYVCFVVVILGNICNFFFQSFGIINKLIQKKKEKQENEKRLIDIMTERDIKKSFEMKVIDQVTFPV